MWESKREVGRWVEKQLVDKVGSRAHQCITIARVELPRGPKIEQWWDLGIMGLEEVRRVRGTNELGRVVEDSKLDKDLLARPGKKNRGC